MIISIDTGKAFEKIQHQFMIKIFQNIGIEGTYLNIIKAIYDKVKVNVKSLSRIQLCGDTMWPTRLLHPWDFPGKSTGEFHGLYSPWVRKKSDTTEQLALSPSLSSIVKDL